MGSEHKQDKAKGKPVDWNKFGLNENSESPRSPDSNTEYDFGPGTLENNELFAQELVSSTSRMVTSRRLSRFYFYFQKQKPWWKSNFFISEPVLFGQWDGVFTSCLINIFGVIVFLRSGWIVAQAGILSATSIVLATVSIALISVLSAVGICERCRMESGGVYFLLAHVLGSRFGGSIGLVYCFGQVLILRLVEASFEF